MQAWQARDKQPLNLSLTSVSPPFLYLSLLSPLPLPPSLHVTLAFLPSMLTTPAHRYTPSNTYYFDQPATIKTNTDGGRKDGWQGKEEGRK